MGGSLRISFIGENSACVKVQNAFLAASHQWDEPKVDNYEDLLHWSISGPNSRILGLIDQVADAVMTAGVSGKVSAEGAYSIYRFFKNGAEVSGPGPTGEGVSFRDCHEITYRVIDDTFTEQSDDFETLDNDLNFDFECMERMNSDGIEANFIANMEYLAKQVRRGWFKISGVMCEDEEVRMDIRFTPDKATVWEYDGGRIPTDDEIDTL